MKIGRIARAGVDGEVARIVAVEPDQERVVDLASAEAARLLRRGATPEAARRLAGAWFPPSLAAALGAGDAFLAHAHAAVEAAAGDAALALDAVSWLPAVDPPVMRDCLVFEEHLINAFGRLDLEPPREYYEIPVYYKGNSRSLIGHGAEVPWPAGSERMDYELELGFVVGRQARDVTPDEARSVLFGVTLFDDFSARDIQAHEMGAMLGPSKSKDFATAVGPWITTTDELDPGAVELVARVNGEEWSRGSTGDMLWPIEEILAYTSITETLHPGDLIGSGTVGRGCGLELGRQLEPGDVVELEAAGVGVLRNRLGQPPEPGWRPTSRARGGPS